LPQSKQINALSNNSNEVKTTASPSPSSPSQATTSAKVTTSIQATISQASNSSVIIDSIDSENTKLSVKEMIEQAKKMNFLRRLFK
jgi:N-acetylmuramoyl-L-alanine amidase CwlA